MNEQTLPTELEEIAASWDGCFCEVVAEGDVEIGPALRRAFSRLASVAGIGAQQVPSAYGLFWKIDGKEILQFPVGATLADCESDRAMYAKGDQAAMTIRPLYTSAATQPASSAAPATAGPSDARGKQLRYDHAELHAAHKAGVLPKADAWMVICDGEPHAYPHLSQYIPWSSNFYAPRWMPLQFMREEVAAPAASVGVEPSDALLKMAKAAMHCLRSYQYGNAQPDLAKAIADALEMTIKNAAPTAHEAGQQPVAWGEWQRVAAEFIERLTVLAYRRGCVSDRNVDGLFAEQQLLEREFLAHLAAPAAPRALLGKALVALTELHEAEEATYPNAEHGQAAQTAWSTRKAEAHEKARAAITELREALGAK